MKLDELLAARLRQAIQGCSLHSHGPVQAWAAIQSASESEQLQAGEVARLALEACTQRIEELVASGVDPADPRVKKEELTRAFIEKLMR